MRCCSAPSTYFWQLFMQQGGPTNTSGITRLLFVQEATQEPKLSELCPGCNCAREEACPGSAHFAPVTDAASLTELGKGILATKSYSFQLHPGSYYSLTKNVLMTWMAAYKHVVGEPLLCMIHCCTRHTRLKGRDWPWAPSSLVADETQHLPLYHNLSGGTAAKFTRSKEIYCLFWFSRHLIESEEVLPHELTSKERKRSIRW